jgi:hypothetical protein
MMDEAKAREHAQDIRNRLSFGDPVFVSSLAAPEREILNQLYHFESPDVPLRTIRSMGADEFVRSFPRIRIREVVLGEGVPSVYRLVP